jgi:hypothetical protein
MKYRIFLQILIGLIAEIFLGIVFVFIGAFIGGNFGFVNFGGNVGYEAGGAFFGTIGLVLGALCGVVMIKQSFKEKIKTKRSLIGAFIITFLFLLTFRKDSPPIFLYLLLLFNPIFFTYILK